MAVIRKPVKAAPAAPKPAEKPAVKAAAALPQEDAASPLVTSVEVLDAAAAQVEEVREFGRTMALNGMDSLRAAYDRSRRAAEEAAGSVEQVYGKMTGGVRELQVKAIENMQANTLAFFEIARTMAGASNPSEALTACGDLCRKQMETAATQAREYAELVKKVSEDVAAPLSATASKAFGIQA